MESGMVMVRTDSSGENVHLILSNWNGSARRAACGKARKDDTPGGGIVVTRAEGLKLRCARCQDILLGKGYQTRNRKKGRGLFDEEETTSVRPEDRREADLGRQGST